MVFVKPSQSPDWAFSLDEPLAMSAAVVYQHRVLVDVLICYYADFLPLFLRILISVKRAMHDF
jgi:hypothetical protein